MISINKAMINYRKFPKIYCKIILVSIFSFILGSMVTLNLIPINKTCRIDKEDREYNIMRNSKLKDPDFVIIILSAPKNIERRNVIRNTWIKLIDNIKKDGRNIIVVKHYFVIGSFGLPIDEIATLRIEQLKYNDILNLPMYDNYSNLSEKVIKTFTWLNEQLDIGLNFKYVLKCDDDSFVRIDNLVHELNHLETIYLKSDIEDISVMNDDTSPYMRVNIQRNTVTSDSNRGLYWGYFSGNANIKTKGKWKESDWILCDRYIPYALGGGYVISKNLLVYLGNNSKYLRYYNSEDISVGAWLATVNNVVRIHDKRFDTEWITRGCQNYYLITHNLSTSRMKELYNNIIKFGYMCEKETIDRAHYLYNWLLPPSKCCSKNK